VKADAERFGARFVGPERRFEVYTRLLELGEACLLPLDAPGQGRGRLLGQDVRTSRAPVRLARSTGSPLAVLGAFWSKYELELRLSSPLDPSSFESDDALYAEMLRIADEWLRPRPEQFLIRFPSVAFWEALKRRDELQASVADARAAEVESKESVRRAEAQREVKLAKRSLKEVRARRQQAEAALREAKDEVRR
jgi:hypothetical protein